jgi:hypothetical protein
MHYPSSSRFAVSSGLRTATSAFPVLSLPPDLSASAAGYATVLPVRVTRYHQPRVARDDGRRGVPRRGLSLLGWTVPTTTPEDRAEPATEVKHPPSFRFITPLSLRTPSVHRSRQRDRSPTSVAPILHNPASADPRQHRSTSVVPPRPNRIKKQPLLARIWLEIKASAGSKPKPDRHAPERTYATLATSVTLEYREYPSFCFRLI